jgi:FAD/FMN-containing dehydrogenase
MTLALPAVSSLRESFGGDLILPDDDRYDGAREVWSALWDRRPALIARPASADDIVAAIRFAREQDLVVATRCGGHSISGHSTCDDGLVIDLSGMRGVTVDPAARIATANGGAHLGELDTAAQAHGLVCPVGVVGHTGVGGLALGGGVGRLQRRFGLTTDNLTAVELVTADGRLVRASEREEPELFWAMRGAGANFGVVTRFEFRLHPFGPNLTRGLRIFRARDAQNVWAAVRGLADTAPRTIGMSFVIGRAVPEDEYPPEVQGAPIVIVGFSHIGTEEDAAIALAPLTAAAEAVSESVGTRSYLEIQTMFDEAYAWGHRYYGYGGFANDLAPETIEALIDHAASAVREASFTASVQGGAIGDLDEDATAYTSRSARFRLLAECEWDAADDDEAIIAWSRRAMAIAEPDTVVGRYVNEVFEDETGPVTIYGEAKLRRLVAIKRAWDPDNTFRMNHNIRP